MRFKQTAWLWCALIVILSLSTCGDEPSPTPPPTAAPTVVGAVILTPEGDTRPRCQVNPPPDWGLYLVQPDDTLSELAERRGATVQEIRRVNCLLSNIIIDGSTLYLPPPLCQVSPPPGWGLYTAQTGDTLFSLAESRHTTVAEVAQVNCLEDEAVLRVGERLYLPALPTPTPTATPTSTPTPLPALPPTPAPLPTFPLVRPTPGIVSIGPPAAPGPLASGQFGPTGGPSGLVPAGGGDLPINRAEIVVYQPFLPRVVITGTATLDASPPEFIDELCTDGFGNYSLHQENELGLYSLCMAGIPINQPITVTLLLSERGLRLSGSFQVQQDNTNADALRVIWQSPLNGLEAGQAVAQSEPDLAIVTIFLFQPVDIPSGNRIVIDSAAATIEEGPASIGSRDFGIFFDPDRHHLRLPASERCHYLNPEEVNPTIQIVGSGFAAAADIPVAVWTYRQKAYEFLSQIVNTTNSEGRLSTSIQIDPADTESLYFVLAVTNPTSEQLQNGVLVLEEISQVGKVACFKVPPSPPVIDSEEIRPIITDTLAITPPPVPQGPPAEADQFPAGLDEEEPATPSRSYPVVIILLIAAGLIGLLVWLRVVKQSRR